jgi:hypothetical protein
MAAVSRTTFSPRHAGVPTVALVQTVDDDNVRSELQSGLDRLGQAALDA